MSGPRSKRLALMQSSMAEIMTDDDIMSMMQEEQVGGERALGEQVAPG